MIKSANELLHEPTEHGGVAINEAVKTTAFLDIAKSLAIIADGITTQNEQMEKLENDLDRLEHSYSSKWFTVPISH